MLYPNCETVSHHFIDYEGDSPSCVYEAYINELVNPKMVLEHYIMGENAAIAHQLEKYDSIGFDCVARCINNIVARGAIPESFEAEIPDAFAEQLIPGFIEGCMDGCCSLEIKTTTKSTIAGTATGIYDMSDEHQSVKSGDRLIGLLSAGLHHEGLVKATRILKLDEENVKDIIPEIFCKMEDELFRRSKIYVRPVMHLTRRLGIKLDGIRYIGEKGFINSITSMLPEGVKAKIWPKDFPISGIFEMISKAGNLSTTEMFNSFNMGLGLVMAVDKKEAGNVMSSLIQMGEHPYVIGCCVDGEKSVELNW